MTESNAIKPVHNAKDILVEALDTIKATFWISNHEFAFANWGSLEYNPKHKPVLLSDYVGIPEDKVKTTGEGRMGALTGVCSIGAITLATAMIYAEPLRTFESQASIDPYTRLAALAVAHAALDQQPHRSTDNEWDEAPISIITGWNDDSDTGRDEVIKAFEAAIKDPILNATEVFVVGFNDYEGGSTWLLPRWFGSKQEAETFRGHIATLAREYHGLLYQARPAKWDEIVERHGELTMLYASQAGTFDLEVMSYFSLTPVSA